MICPKQLTMTIKTNNQANNLKDLAGPKNCFNGLADGLNRRAYSLTMGGAFFNGSATFFANILSDGLQLPG